MADYSQKEFVVLKINTYQWVLGLCLITKCPYALESDKLLTLNFYFSNVLHKQSDNL